MIDKPDFKPYRIRTILRTREYVMKTVEIYTKSWCPYCARAKAQLNRLGISYEEIDVTNDLVREKEMVERAHRTSVPQIFVGKHHVGGSDDLAAAIASGEFERLLDTSAETASAA